MNEWRRGWLQTQPGRDWLHKKAILWVSYCQNPTCFSPDGMSVITHWTAQKKERREAEQCQGKKRNTQNLWVFTPVALIMGLQHGFELFFKWNVSIKHGQYFVCIRTRWLSRLTWNDVWLPASFFRFLVCALKTNNWAQRLIEMSNVWQQVWSKSSRLIAIDLCEWMPTRTFIPRLLCWYFQKRVRIQPQPQRTRMSLQNLIQADIPRAVTQGGQK